MSDQTRSEFEAKDAERRPRGDAAPADVGTPLADEGGTRGAGYGGYGSYGYGYGGSLGTDSEFSLVHYLQIIYRRRYIATSVFLAVVLGVSLYTFTAVRMYEGTVQILIERDNPNVVSFQQVLQQSELADDYYETQYRLLESRALARRVIDTLDLWEHPQFTARPRWSIRGTLMAPLTMMRPRREPSRWSSTGS